MGMIDDFFERKEKGLEPKPKEASIRSCPTHDLFNQTFSVAEMELYIRNASIYGICKNCVIWLEYRLHNEVRKEIEEDANRRNMGRVDAKKRKRT